MSYLSDLFSKQSKVPTSTSEVGSRARDILEALSNYPQFTEVGDLKFVNLLNGCIVSQEGLGLELCWQQMGYETTPHVVYLTTVKQLEKFHVLMAKQAADIARWPDLICASSNE